MRVCLPCLHCAARACPYTCTHLECNRQLIYGSPEHDTCASPNFYYHNNAFILRGIIEGGKFLRDVCPALCPAHAAFGAALLAEAEVFRSDLDKSLNMTVTRDPATGNVTFVPPIAKVGSQPFVSMIESTVSMYSNFRYFAELLGSDVLRPELSVALQEFRESHQGTVSGIVRWSDHLDDMPSIYYLAAALRDDRLPRFLLHLYGHMANYQARTAALAASASLPAACCWYLPACLPADCVPAYLPIYLPTSLPPYLPTSLLTYLPTSPTCLPTYTYLPTLLPTYRHCYLPTDRPTYRSTDLPTYLPSPALLPELVLTFAASATLTARLSGPRHVYRHGAAPNRCRCQRHVA
jgi:hypothetical protein